MRPTLTRRQALQGAGLLAAGAVSGARSPGYAAASQGETVSPKERMPVVFLPHGGGPWPFVNEPLLGPAGMWDRMARYMKELPSVPQRKPRAVLVISAHWEEEIPTVLTAQRPPLLYDYYNFPPEAYEVTWPAPGAPEIASEIRGLLERAGIASGEDPSRGFDHGTFVPLKLMFPEADVPTLQLSLKAGLDPSEHLEIGRALEPLREQGLFIVGSGMSYHNMDGLMAGVRGSPSPRAESKAFDDWLAETAGLEPSARDARLAAWERAPAARACHPREEHLIPLHVCAGAAGDDVGSSPYRDVVMDAHISAVHFG